MRSRSALLLVTLAATPACAPRVPNPVDVARVAIDGSILVVGEAERGVRAAQRASAPPAFAPPSPGGGLPRVVQTPLDPLVEVRFSAEDGESRWLLQSGGRALCETPCTLQYAVGTGVSMVQLEGEKKRARLFVPYLPGGAYDVRARPQRMGAFAPGVIAAAFGGMGTIAGLAVTAVGCGNHSAGACRGGGIALGASAGVLTTGIILLAVSGARLFVDARAALPSYAPPLPPPEGSPSE